MSTMVPSVVQGASSLVNEAYATMRHFPLQDPFREPTMDLPQEGSRPIPGLDSGYYTAMIKKSLGALTQSTRSGVDQFEKLYHQEAAKNAQLFSEIESWKAHEQKIFMEKENVKRGYEEYINRMNAEMEEMKKSELRLEQTLKLKSKLEVELELASRELGNLKGQDNEAVANELRRVINQLVEEKKQLRTSLSSHQTEINKLMVAVTSLKEISNGDSEDAKKKLSELQLNYNELLRNFNELKNKPVVAPPNIELENLLREKVHHIHFLEGKIKDLNERLREKSNDIIICRGCEQKDWQINHLTGRLKTVETRRVTTEPTIIRSRIEQPVSTIVRAPAQKVTYSTSPLRASTYLLGKQMCTCLRVHGHCCCCEEYGVIDRPDQAKFVTEEKKVITGTSNLNVSQPIVRRYSLHSGIKKEVDLKKIETATTDGSLTLGKPTLRTEIVKEEILAPRVITHSQHAFLHPTHHRMEQVHHHAVPSTVTYKNLLPAKPEEMKTTHYQPQFLNQNAAPNMSSSHHSIFTTQPAFRETRQFESFAHTPSFASNKVSEYSQFGRAKGSLAGEARRGADEVVSSTRKISLTTDGEYRRVINESKKLMDKVFS